MCEVDVWTPVCSYCLYFRYRKVPNFHFFCVFFQIGLPTVGGRGGVDGGQCWLQAASSAPVGGQWRLIGKL